MIEGFSESCESKGFEPVSYAKFLEATNLIAMTAIIKSVNRPTIICAAIKK